MTKKEKKKKKITIGDIIVDILLVASLVVLGLAISLAYKFKDNPEEAYLFGYKPIYIMTGSMEPTLREKGVCIVERCGYDDVDVDDIVMYQVEDKTITHRVIEKTEEGIRTKGDNNDVEDAYLLGPDNIRAKVVARFNITAVIVNDFQSGAIGYVKWIGFPLFVILIFVCTPKIIKKIMSMPEDDEKDGKGNDD